MIVRGTGSFLSKILAKKVPHPPMDTESAEGSSVSLEPPSPAERIQPTKLRADMAESEEISPSLAERMQPTKLRMDTAVPEEVELYRTFMVAIAVRQPRSEKLSETDLTNVNSEYAQLIWSSDDPVIDLRIEVSASECDIIDANSLSFQLYQDQDSPNFYFELRSKTVGQINIIVRLYHEKFILGCTRTKTMASAQKVSQVMMSLNSRYTDTSNLTPSFKDPLQDKFSDFVTRKNLVTELLTCATVRSHDTRNMIIDNLPDDIRSRIDRSPTDHIDVMNMVTRTLDYVNGLKDLIEVIYFYEGNSTPMNNVGALVNLDF